jgi:DNA polymerase-3 subunit beta
VKITIEKGALHKALGRVVSVVARKNTIPVLGNLLIDASDDAAGRIWIVATDQDIEARVAVDADVERAGRVTVPADTLSAITSNAPDGAEIVMDWDVAADPRVKVAFGRYKSHLPALGADLFPIWAERAWPMVVTVAAADLNAMLERCAFAICNDQTRTYLLGAYLHAVKGSDGQPRLRVAATNGHRMAYADGPADPSVEGLPGVIIPTKTVSELRRALSSLAGPVQLSACRTGVRLETDDLMISSKVIEGEYIDYSRVVPLDWRHEITVDRNLLIGGVTRTAILSDDRSSPIKMVFGDGVVQLTVRNGQTGQAVEELEIDYAGEPFETGFNARYLLDALRQTEADNIRLCMEDGTSPLRLEPTEDDAEAGCALSVVMPLRV